MAKKNEFANALWTDKKRIMGMPISFTRYTVDNDRLYMKTGFFKTEMNEILLYRILDVKTTRTLGQKIFGVGTVVIFSADQTNRSLELKNVKDPIKVHKFISEIVEKHRDSRGISGREIYGAGGVSMEHIEHECADCEDVGNFNEF